MAEMIDVKINSCQSCFSTARNIRAFDDIHDPGSIAITWKDERMSVSDDVVIRTTPDIDICTLAEMAAIRIGISSSTFCLVYAGAEMSATATLRQYGITSDCAVVPLVRWHGYEDIFVVVVRSGDFVLRFPILTDQCIDVRFVKAVVRARTGIPPKLQLITYRNDAVLGGTACQSLRECSGWYFMGPDNHTLSVLRMDDLARMPPLRPVGEFCCVCLENVPVIRLEPCNHVCICAFCESAMRGRPCPLCRCKVTRFLYT